MITEDQSEVVSFLGSAATHGGSPVERIDTHASIVFLAGTRALKLKRAVRYDYLDFSTTARRKAMCEAEVRVNRRTAPALYRDVVAVTREPTGALAIGGSGTPVDWLVEMTRFDQSGLFDRLATRQALDLALMSPLASAIADLHRIAEPRLDHGGRAGMAWVVDGNAASFAEQGAGVLDATLCARVTGAARLAVERHGARLDARRAHGLIRQCHGDLHLRNIVLLNGQPTLFDAIEFNDEIACIDVLYDLAFLLMDLWRRGLRAHANAVWNAYIGEMSSGARMLPDSLRANGDDGLPLMPLFLSCRAAVRAKTTVTAASLQEEGRRRAELQADARQYLGMADALLSPAPAYIVAIGGLSGTGKSTLAHALAPSTGAVPGAVVVRSDEIRKRLFGVDPLVRLRANAYAPDVSRRVYGMVVERSGAVARGGYVAIADAVFARPEDRRAIEEAARAAGVPFVGLWLDAPEAVLLARAAQRRVDASDADAGVIQSQLAQGTGAVTWERIDAARDISEVVRDARAAIDGVLERSGARGARIA